MSNNLPLKQIFAMGGGGFSMEPKNSLLDKYILGLVNKQKPRVCFVPTASGDFDRYIVEFYSAFGKLSCTPSHLSLFNPPTTDLKAFVLEQNIIYVGGGSPKNLIALWREWELDEILREAWEIGIILCGLSAGSMCWFEAGISAYAPGSLNKPVKCLGFLKGSHCPHYDQEPERRLTYHRLLSEDLLDDGYAADDGVGLHFVGDRLEKIVSSRPNAKAYRVEKIGETVKETLLQPTYLGDLSED
ncbi:peptidase E [Nostoc sp. CHAB 5784]|uniref:Type 1 glutamine amidotransferase-like domain-containing protein n=1 Tax=Nostoc mirabile TaxID=2907820 RepID=UPI001E413B1D|nr:peptidase E [Nostoc mirabile]MCC5668874.1 peptidase E [Nostoc mirabile CHAB5784]